MNISSIIDCKVYLGAISVHMEKSIKKEESIKNLKLYIYIYIYIYI
jgi:hypothetical protein